MGELVLQVPKWQGELVFSKEVLIFLGVILLMIVGVLFCFYGYKFFGTILLIGIGTVMCYGSFLLVEPMTPNTVIRLFLTVSLTFLGVCLAYFLDIIWGFILDKLRIRNVLAKNIYLLAAPLGAAIIGLTIYYMIWRGKIVAIAIACVCLAIGLVFQFFKRKKQVRFKSYNDLMKLPLPERYLNGLEYISAGAVPAASAPALVAEISPEPEPEVALVTEPTPEPETALVTEPTPEPEPEAALVTEPTPEPEPETAFVAEIEEMSAEELIEAKPDKAPVVEAAAPALAAEVTLEPGPEAAFVAEVSSEPEPEVALVTEPTPEPEPEAALVTEIAETPADVLTETEPDKAPIHKAYTPDIELMMRIETVKNIILGEATSEKNTEEEVLDDALFVKKASNTKTRQRPEKASNRSKNTPDRSKSTLSDPRKITIMDNQAITIKLDSKLIKSAAFAAVSVGCFLAGRVSKGGD